MNKLSLIGLPRGRGETESGGVRVRRGKGRRRGVRYRRGSKHSWRLLMIFLFCIGFTAIAVVGIDKLASGGAESFLLGKLKGLLGGGNDFGSIGALGTIVSGGTSESALPKKLISPLLLPRGAISGLRRRKRVDFPEPDCPTMATNSPAVTVSDTSSSARTTS